MPFPAFHAPVWQSMRPMVHHVRVDTPLTVVLGRLDDLAISALLVRDREGRAAGTISRSDLLRVGRERAKTLGTPLLLDIPEGTAGDAMTEGVVSVSAEAPLAEAARRMAGAHIHRVFVQEKAELVGVVTTREILRELSDKQIATPISALMHAAVVVVRTDDTLAVAVERMQEAVIHGIVVVDRHWPVGIFAQEQALAARFAPADESVEHWMSLGFHLLPMDLPAHRAAAQMLETNARRLLAMDAQNIRGILTELDVARAAALVA